VSVGSVRLGLGQYRGFEGRSDTHSHKEGESKKRWLVRRNPATWQVKEKKKTPLEVGGGGVAPGRKSERRETKRLVPEQRKCGARRQLTYNKAPEEKEQADDDSTNKSQRQVPIWGRAQRKKTNGRQAQTPGSAKNQSEGSNQEIVIGNW